MNYSEAIFVGTNYGGAQSTGVATIQNGEILPIGVDNLTLAGGTLPIAAPELRFARGAAGGTRQTNQIEGKNIFGWTGLSYTAPVQQTAFVGYNGTAGNTIAVTASAMYVLRLKFTHQITGMSDLRDGLYTVTFQATSTSTAAQIAAGLAAAVNNSVAINGYVIAAVTNSGANYGISITALSQPFNRELDDYELVTFKVVLGDHQSTGSGNTYAWGNTPTDVAGIISANATGAAQSVAMNPGSGVDRDLMVKERKWAHLVGETINTQFPTQLIPRDVVAGETYDVYILSYREIEDRGTIDGPHNYEHMLWFVLPANANTLRTRFETFMNPYLAVFGFAAVNL